MAKILTGNHVFDATTFISSADATSLSFLSQGSIVLGGVTSVIGSTSADTVSLNLPTTYKPAGFTLDTFAAFGFDTKNTLSSSTDYLIGTTSNDVVNFTNSGTAAMVNARYASSGGTDRIDLTASNDKLYLSSEFTGVIDSNGGADSITGSTVSDLLMLGEGSAQANWFYSAGGSAVDTLIGTSFADSITLAQPSKVNITTGGGADVITGSYGNDSIVLTSATAVTVAGGLGKDLITLPTAAAVSDVVNFSAVRDSSTLALSDSITNFQPGTSSTSVDTLHFSSALQLGVFDYVGVGLMFTGGGDNSEARSMQSGANTIVEVDTNADTLVDMTITLVGVTPTAIDLGDFSFA